MMNIFNIFKKKKQVTISSDYVAPVDLFTCHHCQHRFEVTSHMIFTVPVRILYTDKFCSGKGVTCPKCFKYSIFG